MSRMDQFNYMGVIGRKVESVYVMEHSRGIQSLILHLGKQILTFSLQQGRHEFSLDLYTVNEWIREFESSKPEHYYPFSCFEGKVIKNVRLVDTLHGREMLEIAFRLEDKRMRVAVEDSSLLMLDLDIVRPGFTVNFANKSIEEVEALLLDKQLEASSYVAMTNEVRAVYYYYSCISNVFELAGYIYEIFKGNQEHMVIERPKAYEIAKKMIY